MLGKHTDYHYPNTAKSLARDKLRYLVPIVFYIDTKLGADCRISTDSFSLEGKHAGVNIKPAKLVAGMGI